MTHLDLCFYLDANCVNARQKNQALNDLEQWRDLGRITLIYADATYREAIVGDAKRNEKASNFSWTELNEFGENLEVKRAIEAILFPNGPTNGNQRNDVIAVYHAERLRWPLITMDGNSNSQPGGILGHAAQLATLGVEVITPEQAVTRVKSKLASAG